MSPNLAGNDPRWPLRRADPVGAEAQVQLVTTRCASCDALFAGTLAEGRDWHRGHRQIHNSGRPAARSKPF
jgi:hypothetical protein